MSDCILVGCDLHVKTLVLTWAVDRGPIHHRTLHNDRAGRAGLIQWLRHEQEACGARRVLFAYEASGQGFCLYDQLLDAGFETYVLAPTLIAHSVKAMRTKTDNRDARALFELLRAHVLAGNALPAVWVPAVELRDDRDLVRMRVDLPFKHATTKNQIQGLLKRKELRRPAETGSGWTNAFFDWLAGLATGHIPGLGPGGQCVLRVLLKQLSDLEAQLAYLDEQILKLSREPRYAQQVEALLTIPGVGLVTAMTFLVEIGDLTRFSNRRQLASYLGLVPSSNESGEAIDRKGHIHRHGPSRVRRLLCQASWTLIRSDEQFGRRYDAFVSHSPKRKMVIVVAIMRQLAIIMWRRALEGGPPANKPEAPRKKTTGSGKQPPCPAAA